MPKLFYLCPIFAFSCFAVLAFTAVEHSKCNVKEIDKIVITAKKEASIRR